jgi:sec-independent protein translocase protein TatC
MGDSKNTIEPVETTMTLGEHLEELRLRLILALLGLAVAVGLCLFFGTVIIAFIERPYIEAMGKQARLQSLAPADGFTSYMEISAMTGVVLASPWIFYQLWMFVSAGLYPHEKRYVYMATPFSAGLFVTGALFFVFIIAPVTLKFLVMFNKQILGVDSNFTFQNYVSFITMMMLIFGLAFQTPIAIFFLVKTGIVSIQAMARSRKIVIFGIVVLAAVATPGSDVFSLFSLAIPLYLLFEAGIALAKISERRAKSRRIAENT